MQIGGANLLASLLAPRQQQPQQPKQAAPFEPLPFRQTAPETPQASDANVSVPPRPARPGTHVDIKV